LFSAVAHKKKGFAVTYKSVCHITMEVYFVAS